MNNKNYYEILQIDKKASKEIMDKAYKTLIKKYHPDLQENENKEKYEEIIKRINEAYDVLSDDEKREKYDKTIASNYISQEDFKKLYNENQQLKQQLNNTYSYINQNYKKTINNNDFNYNQNANTNINSSYEQRVNETINQAYKKAYHDAYIQDLKNRGYKIKYKKTFKDIIKDIVSFIITFIIIYSFLNIPFIKNYIIYSFSPLLKIIK